MDQEKHSSIYVAPLNIYKGAIRLPTGHPDTISSTSRECVDTHGPSEREELNVRFVDEVIPDEEESQPEPSPAFHTYLRAFYDYQPSNSGDSSTVTLPLRRGDILLIHSVHTNGWADGTLLTTGARGWLPTNYCENYDNETTRPLLSALTTFWDLAQGASSIRELFASQDHVRGLVAGARCVLVSILATNIFRC